MASGGPSTQHFHGNIATGNARVQYGNVHHHYAERTELEQQQRSIKLTVDRARDVRDTITDMINWLAAADVSYTHHDAYKKHEPGTGRWFLDSEKYSGWLAAGSRILWLHGKAGCCKTILCSMLVEDIARHVSDKDSTALAYFYFSFRDVAKQSYQAWLLSTISQLLSAEWKQADAILKLLEGRAALLHKRQEHDGPHPDILSWSVDKLDIALVYDDLRAARARNHKHPKDLELILRDILSCKESVYLVLDGLDESPETGDLRKDVMEGLKKTVNEHEKVKMLITSRRESDIELFMNQLCDSIVAIEVKPVNDDIMRYVNTEMERHHKLSSLGESTKNEIKCTLAEKADGMFRWVFCQLDQIKQLKLLTPTYVSRALRDLPKTLDETYERILVQYDGIHEVRVAMEWLAFSVRPLNLQELREACLVTADDDCYLQESGRSAIKELLLGMTSLIQAQSDANPDSAREVTLGHYSVKEYLVSVRIQQSAAASFFLMEEVSHATIAQSCIAYILHACRPKEYEHNGKFKAIHFNADGLRPAPHGTWLSEMDASNLAQFSFILALRYDYLSVWHHFPLLTYAIRWVEHQRRTEPSRIAHRADQALQFSLFNSREAARFLRYIAACPLRASPMYRNTAHDRKLDRNLSIDPEFASRSSIAGFGLILASHEGLIDTVKHIVNQEIHWSEFASDLAIALVAASRAGNTDIAQCVVDGGANIDFVCGKMGTALEQACFRGHTEIVSLLLEHNADHSLFAIGTPLQRASKNGYEQIVRLLLEKGASPNYVPTSGTALQQAAGEGHQGIIKDLLSAGADPNLLGEKFGGTAIQRAACEGHTDCVRLLAQAGGDPDRNEPETYAAIYRAIFLKRVESIEALIDAGATLGRGHRANDTPLHAAIRSYADDIAHLLLRADAPVNEQVEEQSNLLELAIRNTAETSGVVEAILRAGFNVDVLPSPFVVTSEVTASILARYNVRNLYQSWVEAYRIDLPEDIQNQNFYYLDEFNQWHSACVELGNQAEGQATSQAQDRRQIYVRWTDEFGQRLLAEDWAPMTPRPEYSPPMSSSERSRGSIRLTCKTSWYDDKLLDSPGPRVNRRWSLDSLDSDWHVTRWPRSQHISTSSSYRRSHRLTSFGEGRELQDSDSQGDSEDTGDIEGENDSDNWSVASGFETEGRIDNAPNGEDSLLEHGERSRARMILPTPFSLRTDQVQRLKPLALLLHSRTPSPAEKASAPEPEGDVD
ncbi:hypothetical protein AC578_5862 [Pseudocercospora eumusae]|uniref:Nephrocystin 3-like N-terminal domain-containing protein n=1 Tax=Pseudocercospora eumusae TaxID=321146 RepID=A0A139HD43_9PEZI|nr:hypothetical protein AC578_5862 [Pseudocercospora eumusae]